MLSNISAAHAGELDGLHRGPQGGLERSAAHASDGNCSAVAEGLEERKAIKGSKKDDEEKEEVVEVKAAAKEEAAAEEE